MSLSVNAKTYTADGFTADSVHFQGPNKSTTVVDDLIRKRYPVKGANSGNSGYVRYLLKLARSHSLTGALTTQGGGYIEVHFLLPVGISDADRDAYCADIGAYLATAGFKADLKSAQVNG